MKHSQFLTISQGLDQEVDFDQLHDKSIIIKFLYQHINSHIV